MDSSVKQEKSWREKQAERKKNEVGRGQLARKEMSPIRRMTEQIQSRRMRASLLHPSGSWVLLGVYSSHSALPSPRFPQQLVVALCGWETATALGSGGTGGPAVGRQTACATPLTSHVTVTHKHTHCRQRLLLAAVSPDFPRFSLHVCVCLCVSVWVSECVWACGPVNSSVVLCDKSGWALWPGSFLLCVVVSLLTFLFVQSWAAMTCRFMSFYAGLYWFYFISLFICLSIWAVNMCGVWVFINVLTFSFSLLIGQCEEFGGVCDNPILFPKLLTEKSNNQQKGIHSGNKYLQHTFVLRSACLSFQRRGQREYKWE